MKLDERYLKETQLCVEIFDMYFNLNISQNMITLW